MPINENFPLRPFRFYGRTKLALENMLTDFDVAHGLKSISLRDFNAAGADPDAELGERHEPEIHAIPLAVLAALGRIEGFKLFGNDFYTEDELRCATTCM